MKTPSSEMLAMMLDDPLLRMHLSYSWPRVKCDLCGREAQGVFAVHFHAKPCANGEDEDYPDWYEYHLGCHACYTSDYAKGVKPQAELPLVRTSAIKYKDGVKQRHPDGRVKKMPLTIPLPVQRTHVDFILPITCISQASSTVQILLS